MHGAAEWEQALRQAVNDCFPSCDWELLMLFFLDADGAIESFEADQRELSPAETECLWKKVEGTATACHRGAYMVSKYCDP